MLRRLTRPVGCLISAGNPEMIAAPLRMLADITQTVGHRSRAERHWSYIPPCSRLVCLGWHNNLLVDRACLKIYSLYIIKCHSHLH